MIVDVAAFIGAYPYTPLPESSPEYLLAQMDRIGIGEAWVGHLPFRHGPAAPEFKPSDSMGLLFELD